MSGVTRPLREEHQELLPHIESLRTAADAIDTLPAAEVQREVRGALEFLQGHLIPHAIAEDEALYPVVARLMGAPQATATMRRDHVEVGKLTGELAALAGLEAPTEHQRAEMRRLLYGLYAIVSLHFAKEEEVYLPLLDERLPAPEAAAMFEAMEAAAAKAKAAHAA